MATTSSFQLTSSEHQPQRKFRRDRRGHPYCTYHCQVCGIETRHKELFEEVDCGETVEKEDTVRATIRAQTVDHDRTCDACDQQLADLPEVVIHLEHANTGHIDDWTINDITCPDCTAEPTAHGIVHYLATVTATLDTETETRRDEPLPITSPTIEDIRLPTEQ